MRVFGIIDGDSVGVGQVIRVYDVLCSPNEHLALIKGWL